MKGDSKVIKHLNQLLTTELTSIHQYFIHSQMYQNWGFSKLHERIRHEMDDETKHAEALIERLLFLEATPNLQDLNKLNIGSAVPEMLESDLQLEMTVAKALKEAIACCETQKDYVTRETLEFLLKETEEDHAWWLETQLGLIKKVGLKNYLQAQM